MHRNHVLLHLTQFWISKQEFLLLYLTFTLILICTIHPPTPIPALILYLITGHQSRKNPGSTLRLIWSPAEASSALASAFTLFCALMLASCSRSRTATESEGIRAARCSAVFPLMSTRLGSASCSSKMATQRSCWHCTACQAHRLVTSTMLRTEIFPPHLANTAHSMEKQGCNLVMTGVPTSLYFG